MKNLVPAVSLPCLMMLGPPSASAAQQCAEVESAKVALRTSSANSPQAGARSQDVQSPRNSQDVRAPRNQDIQSPRNQDVQSPRGQQLEAQSAQQRQQIGGVEAPWC
jgi:hypothetical protein